MTTQLTTLKEFDADNFVLSAIENDANLQPSTKKKYTQAVQNYLGTGGSITDVQALRAYSQTVGASTASFLSAAITKLAKELEMLVKSGATPENVLDAQAMVYRAEAMQNAIPTKQSKGQKAHTWLSRAEVLRLYDSCGGGIRGQRDRLAIGLLVAAGLRRQEAADLTFEDVLEQPAGDGTRTVLAIKGKGAKDRVIPINDNLAEAIREWGEVVGGEGRVLRGIRRGGHLDKNNKKMSGTAIYNLVQKRGDLIGKDDLQPHDLRRTYAQLGYEAGVPISQISLLLGHANIETTQRYLNIELDTESTVSDFIPFKG